MLFTLNQRVSAVRAACWRIEILNAVYDAMYIRTCWKLVLPVSGLSANAHQLLCRSVQYKKCSLSAEWKHSECGTNHLYCCSRSSSWQILVELRCGLTRDLDSLHASQLQQVCCRPGPYLLLIEFTMKLNHTVWSIQQCGLLEKHLQLTDSSVRLGS
jgi:hypothetical protein